MSQQRLSRSDHIMGRMQRLEAAGIVRDCYVYSPGTGRKWVFTPCGFGERSLTTSQVEDFVLGAKAALNARRAS